MQNINYIFLSPTYNNILKISRTIADLSNKERIDVSCIAEAIQYKVDNKFYKKEV